MRLWEKDSGWNSSLGYTEKMEFSNPDRDVFQLSKHTHTHPFTHTFLQWAHCVLLCNLQPAVFYGNPPSQLWPLFYIWTFQLATGAGIAEELQCIRIQRETKREFNCWGQGRWKTTAGVTQERLLIYFIEEVMVIIDFDEQQNDRCTAVKIWGCRKEIFRWKLYFQEGNLDVQLFWNYNLVPIF